QLQGTHGMIGAQLHRGVDALYRGNAVRVDAYCLVDHGNQDTVYHEACCLLNLNRGLSDLSGDGFDLLNRLRRSVQSRDYLNQLHNRSRVEEMHADYRTVQPRADLCDGQRGGVGGENAVCLADILQLFEGLFFDLHVLQGGLYDQIAVCADGLNAGGDL